MSKEESDIGYLPTQAIAEYIKNNGYDGIKYSSSISKDGYNIAVFNSSNMRGLEISKVVIVSGVIYSYILNKE